MPRNNNAKNFTRQILTAALSLLLASCGGAPTASPTSGSGAGKSVGFSLLWRRQTAGVPDFARITRRADGGYCTVGSAGGVFFTTANGAALEDAFFFLPSDGLYTATGCGGDIVAAVNRDGTLHVYTQSGEALWSVELNTRVLGAPLIERGRVFVLGVNGRLSAYAANTGELLWQYLSPLKSSLNTPVDGAAAIDGERVYIGVNNGGISALNFSDGQPLWENSVSETQGANPVASIANVTTPFQQGNFVCAAAYQSGVSCFVATSGDSLWNAPLSATRRAASDADGGRLFVADNHHFLRAYETNNGNLLWTAETSALATSAPLLVDGVVFVGGEDGVLRAFSTVAEGENAAETLGSFSLGGAILDLQKTADGDIIALTAGGGLTRVNFQYE